MSRYFFHLHESGSVTLDEEGSELADLAQGRHFGLKGARGLMAAQVCEGHLYLDGKIQVVDAGGAEVMSLPLAEAVAISPPTA
ncbi:DUF6894 family protein [Sphingomonas sp. PAMC 26617]|uniref:DUF6894 family protein n=1 Tax=Sphingomonas sp. PAMC 26617 TaxID=1112216 RepID=UPI0002889F8E|nr:hypothetical protein [Sphingomonas sp. PAMC 26617]